MSNGLTPAVDAIAKEINNSPNKTEDLMTTTRKVKAFNDRLTERESAKQGMELNNQLGSTTIVPETIVADIEQERQEDLYR